jgi:peptidoglycan hydrolase-like protein with peptidoglycan-binding domain
VLRFTIRACARTVAACLACAVLSTSTALAAGGSAPHSGGASLGGTTTTATATAARAGSDGGLGRRTLRQGMHGQDVRALQRALTAAGYPTAADGVFGPRTRASLIAYQRANGMRATGVLTRSEARTLNTAKASSTTVPTATAGTATIGADGQLELPAGAPAAVTQIVSAANAIIDAPYVWGGGHASFTSNGYDCSGAVSYALHGAGLLSSPEDSTGLESFGESGRGRWVTVYADAQHAFLVVDGRAFDTADFGGPNIPSGSGPRWRTSPTANLNDGGDYIVRHPPGL